MNLNEFREERRKKIAEYEQYGQTEVTSKNFGKIRVIGKRHEEAAEWLKNETQVATKADEIRKDFQCEELFDVLIENE